MKAVKLSVPLGFSKKVRTRWASPPNLSLLLMSFSMFPHSPFTKGAELVSYKVSYRTQIQGGPSASGKSYVDGNQDIAPGRILGAFIRGIHFVIINEQNNGKN